MKVVPEPSERCTTTIACDGNLAFGLSFLIAASSQVLISPRKILASVGPSSTRSPRLDAVEIDDRHDAAHDHRELGKTVLVEILALQRRIGGAEGDGLGLDLLDAAAGADRLVVQADAGLLLIGVGPFGVDRIGKGRAGAGNVGGRRQAATARQAAPAAMQSVDQCFTWLSPVARMREQA